MKQSGYTVFGMSEERSDELSRAMVEALETIPAKGQKFVKAPDYSGEGAETLNKEHIGTDFFEEVNVGGVVVVKIGLDEIMSIPISPYKGTHSFFVDAYVCSKLQEAGVPISMLTYTVRDGEIRWWDDIESGERVFVWKEGVSVDTSLQF